MKSSKTTVSESVINTIVNILEVIISLAIIGISATLLVSLLYRKIKSGEVINMTDVEFRDFLSQLLSLVVALEFVKLLVRQRAIDLVEVMMLTIARQLVVEHVGMLEMILGVIALAGIFAMRKFLFTKYDKIQLGNRLKFNIGKYSVDFSKEMLNEQENKPEIKFNGDQF